MESQRDDNTSPNRNTGDARITSNTTTNTTTSTERETVTRRVRRGPGGWWWLALALVPLLLGGLATLIKHGSIEDDLTKRSNSALNAAGITGATTKFSGRDGTITLPAGADAAKAKDAVTGVDGVRVADVKGGAAATPTAPSSSATSDSPSASDTSSAPPAAGAASALTATVAGDSVTVEGTVPDEATKTSLIADATKAAAPKKVIDKLTVSAGATAPTAAAVSGALEAVKSWPNGAKLAYDGNAVTLTGQVPDTATKTAAGDAAKKAFPQATVDNQLTTVSSSNDACGNLASTMGGLLKTNQPKFGDNSTTLSANPSLDKIAALIKACPNVKVQVQGYTDNTGSAANNVRLSQGRADAVRTYLIDKGDAAANLTAKGFGQASPIADNNTAEGRAANRRVELSVLGG